MLKELVEYNGIDTFYHKSLTNFKQFNVNSIFCIPIEKPDIGQILKVWAKYSIEEEKIIRTPQGTSYEGQILTGYKTFLSGHLCFKLEYISKNGNSSIHSINLELPFSSYITLCKDFNESMSIFPSVYIEDIYCEPINTREIYINITLMSIIDISY